MNWRFIAGGEQFLQVAQRQQPQQQYQQQQLMMMMMMMMVSRIAEAWC
jgi:hypothetical protein